MFRICNARFGSVLRDRTIGQRDGPRRHSGDRPRQSDPRTSTPAIPAGTARTAAWQSVGTAGRQALHRARKSVERAAEGPGVSPVTGRLKRVSRLRSGTKSRIRKRPRPAVKRVPVRPRSFSPLAQMTPVIACTDFRMSCRTLPRLGRPCTAPALSSPSL